MKKFLTAFLLACSCALTIAAIGCNDSSKSSASTSDSSTSSAPVLGDERSVVFEDGEGYTFTSNAENGVLREGATLTFELDHGAFYTDATNVLVNGAALSANDAGVYTYVVGAEDLVVTAQGVRKDISSMQGSGTMDDAFVITKPIDLIHIANKVNSGDTAYTRGAYILANDIDCKGEELEIIGNYSTTSAIFSGSIACENDSETGEYIRHTISNFTINAEDSNYVGLFGAVFVDMSLESSALFYGINLDNFTINTGVSQITDDNKTISCGGLVGYAVGANFYLCDITNGKINVSADQNYFSFVGGLIGYQQGYYDTTYGYYFPSEVSYCKVDVDVNVLGGVALYAGGVSGFLTTNYPYGATASVQNSYFLGSVTGALRSGGIAGGLGQYTAVTNCYAAAEISARSYQAYASPFLTSVEYSYAFAGGLVGYAENDTIAHDSFFVGSCEAFAESGSAYEITHPAIAGGQDAKAVSVLSEKYVVLNCLDEVDLSDKNFFEKNLGWGDYNWVFAKGKLPDINYEAAEDTVTLSMTLKYVAPLLSGEDKWIKMNDVNQVSYKYFDTFIQSLNAYSHIGSFMASGSLAQYYEADNGYLSYGYFFDEECTQKIPFAYMPMKEITIYIGFADPTPVVGNYYLVDDEGTDVVEITLTKEGNVVYTDGASTLTTPYSFDGERIWIEGARFARYYLAPIPDADEDDTSVLYDPAFDLYRYNFYNFEGKLIDGGVVFFDGTYFTEADPLVAKKDVLRGEYFVKTGNGVTYYSFYGETATVESVTNELSSFAVYDTVVLNGDTVTLSHSKGTYASVTINKNDLSSYDIFKGVWAKSATVNKFYTFDGEGNWNYAYVSYERSFDYSTFSYVYDENLLASASGEYDVEGDILSFTHNGVDYSAQFNSDGFLEIIRNGQKEIYYAQYSYTGTWKSNDYEITLNGIRNDGVGYANIVDATGYATELIYEVSETDGVIAFYYPETASSLKFLFGYAIYDVATNVLTLTHSTDETDSGYIQDALYLYDDYYGDWVCNLPELIGVEFTFDGMGLYSHLGMTGKLTLTEDGKKTIVDYELTSSLSGKFAYKGVTYGIEYDENENVVNVTLGAETSLERKDELANINFVSIDGTKYTFDGKSTLVIGGTLSIDGTPSYKYQPAENGFDVYSENIKVGSIVKTETHYLLTINGRETELYIENEFMGDWAISNQYSLFHIGPTDLTGVVKATFKGADVSLTYINPTTLTFYYRDGKMPYTYYVYVIFDVSINENVLVFSEFTNIAEGEYFVCTRVNKLFGTWESKKDGMGTTLKFDGVSSGYVNGYAELTLELNYTEVVTEYFYMIRDEGIVMWSRELMAERTWYFRLELVPENEIAEAAKEDGAYVLRDENGNVVQVLRRVPVLGLYLTQTYDKDGVSYFFDYNDGMNTVNVNGDHKYTYVIRSYNNDNTATIELTEIATGDVYSATINYQDSTNILFILGERIVEEEEDEPSFPEEENGENA